MHDRATLISFLFVLLGGAAKLLTPTPNLYHASAKAVSAATFTTIVLTNVKLALVVVLLSVSFGLFSTVIAFQIGYQVIGLVESAAIHGVAAYKIFLFLAPHGIIEIYAFTLALSVEFRFVRLVMKRLMLGTDRQREIADCVVICKIMLSSFSLLIVSALVETIVTQPLISRFN